MVKIHHSSAHLLQQEGWPVHHVTPTAGHKLVEQAMEPVERGREHGRALHLDTRATGVTNCPLRMASTRQCDQMTWCDHGWSLQISLCMYVPHVYEIV